MTPPKRRTGHHTACTALLFTLEGFDMPNCFQLTRNGETSAETLSSIDRRLCELLGVPVHETQYVVAWYDHIGLAIACGHALGSQDLRDLFADYEALTKCLVYLETHYTSSAWHERK